MVYMSFLIRISVPHLVGHQQKLAHMGYSDLMLDRK